METKFTKRVRGYRKYSENEHAQERCLKENFGISICESDAQHTYLLIKDGTYKHEFVLDISKIREEMAEELKI